jgi:hypothetical protein
MPAPLDVIRDNAIGLTSIRNNQTEITKKPDL